MAELDAVWAGCLMEQEHGVWHVTLKDGRVFEDLEGEVGPMTADILGRLRRVVADSLEPLLQEGTSDGFVFDLHRWERVWNACRHGEDYVDTPCGLRVWDPYPEQPLEQRGVRLEWEVRRLEAYAQRCKWSKRGRPREQDLSYGSILPEPDPAGGKVQLGLQPIPEIGTGWRNRDREVVAKVNELVAAVNALRG